jgi:hypothetical protein
MPATRSLVQYYENVFLDDQHWGGGKRFSDRSVPAIKTLFFEALINHFVRSSLRVICPGQNPPCKGQISSWPSFRVSGFCLALSYDSSSEPRDIVTGESMTTAPCLFESTEPQSGRMFVAPLCLSHVP